MINEIHESYAERAAEAQAEYCAYRPSRPIRAVLGTGLRRPYGLSSSLVAPSGRSLHHELPQFAPLNGLCPNCGRNIYRMSRGESGRVAGFTVKAAGSRLITGCPHCGQSFCE